MITWLGTHAQLLLYVNIGWCALLTVAFLAGKDYPRALYFGGAAVLTVGVLIMK